MFTIPIVHWPILWYGFLFALGFILGFPIFVGILQRFFLQRPFFEEFEIVGNCKHPRLLHILEKGSSAVVAALNAWLISEDSIENRISKRNARFAACSMHAAAALRRLKLENLFPSAILSFKRQAVFLADRLTLYMVIATVVGARLGHFLFYERPADYLRNPQEILQIWRGGLASHGAAIAIVIALGLFVFRYRQKLRGLTWLHLLDFVCVPTALAGAFIRLGNFFNQEILGTKTDVPWAVVFGQPADLSIPAPRHPVQLYEAFLYALIFCWLWRLTFRPKYILSRGKLLGLFLILVFGARFVIEYWKEEQSRIIPFSFDLTMGQLLSIPAILIGCFLLWRARFKRYTQVN